MKVLVCVLSWVGGCSKGVHKAQRDTFLADIKSLSNVDYKIFVGDGTPTGEDEYDINKSFENAHPLTQGKNASNAPKAVFDYEPKSDEVVLSVPDDMVHISYKAKSAWKWALENDYDYVFNCFCDTYVDVSRLINSGFEDHDFCGMTYDANRCPQGGAGYWLSRKCLEIMTTSHVDFWAYDGWAGWTLQKHDIHLYNDGRYAQYPTFPSKDNDVISSHLGVTPYKVMRLIHHGLPINQSELKVYVDWCDVK